MSSSNSPALVLEIHESGLGLFSSLGLLCVTLLMLLLIDLDYLSITPAWSFVLLVIALAGCSMMLWQSGYRQPSRRVCQLIWQQQGEWSVRFADGTAVNAELAPQSWVTGRMWCLRFISSDQPVLPVFIWHSQVPDSVWQACLTRLHLQGHHFEVDARFKSS